MATWRVVSKPILHGHVSRPRFAWLPISRAVPSIRTNPLVHRQNAKEQASDSCWLCALYLEPGGSRDRAASGSCRRDFRSKTSRNQIDCLLAPRLKPGGCHLALLAPPFGWSENQVEARYYVRWSCHCVGCHHGLHACSRSTRME